VVGPVQAEDTDTAPFRVEGDQSGRPPRNGRPEDAGYAVTAGTEQLLRPAVVQHTPAARRGLERGNQVVCAGTAARVAEKGRPADGGEVRAGGIVTGRIPGDPPALVIASDAQHSSRYRRERGGGP